MQNPLLFAALFGGLSILAGCSSDQHHSDYSSQRYYRDDLSAQTAGYDHRPWRDDAGYLHHDADWKADSDRGRLSNDRDDRFDRY
ncbi:MAG TPA: hypothetical protein VH475_30040 [Tepidisphaeraceae bacterium]|jgi:hypothetical protein